MDFGDVLKRMMLRPGDRGLRFARAGWRRKGAFIYLVSGREVDADGWNGSPLTHREIERGRVRIEPHIDMCTADGTRVIGWTPTATDMLADDWRVVE